MQFPLAVKAAAFDLDGTLLDTLPDIGGGAAHADRSRPTGSERGRR
jgi:FMN phosphatase YigB (HAD superfamily)